MWSRPALAAAFVLAASAGLPQEPSFQVTAGNALDLARPAETIEVPLSALGGLKPDDLARVGVVETRTGRELPSQPTDGDGDHDFDRLVFQADFGPKETKAFTLTLGQKHVPRPEEFRVYGRFVRERFDDFAWENDRVAHRMYGTALETWEREPLTSSTVDVWLKRTRRLVLNDWYMADDYHRDNGEGADFYSAGRSRGCGGSGLWRDGKLVVSRNFRESRVLANGPIRLVFELRYPLWDASGIRSETKRVTLDAGQNFNRFENRYDADNAATYAAGIKKTAAANVRIERDRGWFRTWEPVKEKENLGQFGCAVVIDPLSVIEVTEAEGNQVMVARTPAVYYAGSAWDRSGDFPRGKEDFDHLIDQWTQRIKSPVRVEVSAQ